VSRDGFFRSLMTENFQEDGNTPDRRMHIDDFFKVGIRKEIYLLRNRVPRTLRHIC
jgi:hypothetical protein